MYEISEGTLAVLANEDGTAKILDEEGSYKVKEQPFQIMDYGCQYFGSSYLGREKGSQNMIGSRYKLPIIVEEEHGLIFFPTISPSQKDCCWISLKQIKDYQKHDYDTKIIFRNNTEIILPISFRSIENQILRATRLESVLRSRKNH